MDTEQCVAESNRIEGIFRPPTPGEIEAHEAFMDLVDLTIVDLEQFVKVYQPDARLRDKPGLNVLVGGHVPPPGGPNVRQRLQSLLDRVNEKRIDAWDAHVEYETIHPFTDGNGRSGRAMWYWMMRDHRFSGIGFLHGFYYQTLAKCGHD